MEKYKAVKKVSRKLKHRILETLILHEKYKKSYFWNPARTARNRRLNELRFSGTHTGFTIQTERGELKIDPTYSESCNHVYYKLNIFLNNKKKTISELRKIIK